MRHDPIEIVGVPGFDPVAGQFSRALLAEHSDPLRVPRRCRRATPGGRSKYVPATRHVQRGGADRAPNWAPGNRLRAVWSNWMEGRTGDDSDLVARLRRGDPRAFEDLVIAYQHRVFGVALRMLGSRAEAQDLAQEVFLRVHGAIADFRG